MELVNDPAVQSAGGTAGDALDLFFAWVFTPTGATLTLLLVCMGAGSVVLRVLGRTGRVLKTCITITGVLLFVWIVTGILSAMGLPVREWIAGVGAWLPRLGEAVLSFLERLFATAG